MPDRIIRERALTSPTLDQLSAEAERLHWRLTVVADDYGRFDADPRVLLARCFPLKVGLLKADRLEPWRNELAWVGLICLYRVRERLYGVYATWATHQRKRESKPKYPSPEEGITYVPPHPPRVAASCRQSPRVAARARTLESRESLTSESRVLPRAESREPGTADSGGELPPVAADAQPGELPALPLNGHLFALWPEIQRALTRCQVLGQVSTLRQADWWLAELEANPTVDLVTEVLKAEAWIHANPERAPRSRHRRFLHGWLGRADRDE